jgi:hypothetical protein
MAQLKNFATALYIMRLNANSKYDGILKIGISNNVERRKKEIGGVEIEYQDAYRIPRAKIMATEMLAQAFAYRKVGRPTNFRQALPVRSGSSEFFNTTNIRQARGFVVAARRIAEDKEAAEIIDYVKLVFRDMKKRLPKSFRIEVARINQTLELEKAA